MTLAGQCDKQSPLSLCNSLVGIPDVRGVVNVPYMAVRNTAHTGRTWASHSIFAVPANPIYVDFDLVPVDFRTSDDGSQRHNLGVQAMNDILALGEISVLVIVLL